MALNLRSQPVSADTGTGDPQFGVASIGDLDARIEALSAELGRLLSERVEARWPGLKAAYVSGNDAIEDVAAAFRMSISRIYKIARQCGWGRRLRRRSGLSRKLVGEKLRDRWNGPEGETMRRVYAERGRRYAELRRGT